MFSMEENEGETLSILVSRRLKRRYIARLEVINVIANIIVPIQCI